MKKTLRINLTLDLDEFHKGEALPLVLNSIEIAVKHGATGGVAMLDGVDTGDWSLADAPAPEGGWWR